MFLEVLACFPVRACTQPGLGIWQKENWTSLRPDWSALAQLAALAISLKRNRACDNWPKPAQGAKLSYLPVVSSPIPSRHSGWSGTSFTGSVSWDSIRLSISSVANNPCNCRIDFR
jgi:hypothetical protein